MNKLTTHHTLPLQHINPQAYTPASHWTSGAVLPPDGARERIARYELYKTLFEGDHSIITNGSEYKFNALQVNYFRDIPLVFADMLMGFPPTDDSRDDELMYQLNQALYQSIIDYVIHGVGLIFPYDVDNEIRFEAVSPVDWYPMPNEEGDVWVQAGQEFVDVFVLEVNGVHERRRYERSDKTKVTDDQSYLQALVDVTPIQRVAEGQRSIYSVQSPPKYGEFGSSWLPELAPFNVALTQVNTDILRVTHKHSYPLLVETGLEESVSFTDGDEAQFEALKIAATRTTGGVYQTPAASVDYLTWDSNIESLFRMRDDLKEDILTKVSLPLSVLGLFNENSPTGAVSGEALRRTFIVAYNKIRRVQNDWLHALNTILDAVEPNDSSELEWPHPLGEEEQKNSEPLEDNADVFDTDSEPADNDDTIAGLRESGGGADQSAS